jgi:AcrR family transcriptional regulator
MKVAPTSDKRIYSMGSRADSAAATGERILDATEELFWSGPLNQLTIDGIARRAGVSGQTVVRRYGGKEGVIAAAAERAFARVAEQRNTAPIGDLDAAVTVLMDHYEANGDNAMQLLAEEHSSPTLEGLVEAGRELHRDWCARVFAGALSGLKGAARKRRTAQFVAICDVYTWKLMRRDCGLSRAQTETALLELLRPMTGED